MRGNAGESLVSQSLEKLNKYVGIAYDYIVAALQSSGDSAVPGSILMLGSQSPSSRQVLSALRTKEADAEWATDIESAPIPWQLRIILHTLQAVASDYDQNRWMLRDDPIEEFGEYSAAVRQHMDKSLLLVSEGKIVESIAAMARIVDLDPSNAVLHEFVGNTKKLLDTDWETRSFSRELSGHFGLPPR